MKLKFRMSDAEILDYMDAAIDKDKAVDSLAVKCHTTRGLMREHLGELGVLLDEPEKKPLGEFKAVEPKKKQGGAHNKKMDEAKAREMYEAKAREMYDAGANDFEIAAMFGMTAVAVCSWRRRNGLPSKHPRGSRRKENTEMKNDMNPKNNEDVGKEADFAMEARRAERELQESSVEPPMPVKPRPAGNIRMEPREVPPDAPPPSGWSMDDFSMAHRCIGVIEGVAEGITMNLNAKDRLLQAARTLCELMEKARISN